MSEKIFDGVFDTVAPTTPMGAELTPEERTYAAARALASELPVTYTRNTVRHAVTGLSQVQDICHQLAAKSGWWKDLETGEDVRDWPKKFFDLMIANKLMLTVTEVSEAMEGHRKDLMDDKLPHRKMLEVELADAVIRILDLAGALNMDIAGAVAEKLSFNQVRADHKIENRVAEGGKAL